MRNVSTTPVSLIGSIVIVLVLIRVALLVRGLLAGCTEPFTFGPRARYEIPKVHWDRCPFPRTTETVKLPTVGYEGTRF